MKQIIRYILLAGIFAAVLQGCKKEEEKENPDPEISAGDFIEFKVDGHLYRLEENLTNMNKLVIGSARHEAPAYGKYGLIVAFARVEPEEEATLIIMDDAKITRSHYDLTPVVLEPNETPPNFIFSYIRPDGAQYTATQNSSGSLDFTKIDTVMNGVVEGSFRIHKVDLRDEEQELVSRNHEITEGRFRTRVR